LATIIKATSVTIITAFALSYPFGASGSAITTSFYTNIIWATDCLSTANTIDTSIAMGTNITIIAGLILAVGIFAIRKTIAIFVTR
jgi:hypothetical protein